LDLASDTFPHLASLEELAIDVNADQFHVPCASQISFFSNLWESFSCIRKLSIRATVEGLQLLPCPTSHLKFPVLTDLEISFISLNFLYNSHQPRILLQNHFQPFIQALMPTLESLSISIPSGLASIFIGLDSFPRLRRLYLHLNTYQITTKERSAFISFISRQRQDLEHLKLSLDPPSSETLKIHKALCQLNLPHLRELGLPVSPILIVPPQDNIAFPSVPALQSLAMEGVMPPVHSAHRFLDGLACLMETSELSRIRLHVDILPNLRELDITFNGLYKNPVSFFQTKCYVSHFAYPMYFILDI
jgi:hypothetical protein